METRARPFAPLPAAEYARLLGGYLGEPRAVFAVTEMTLEPSSPKGAP
jgi:hypothetical protein